MPVRKSSRGRHLPRAAIFKLNEMLEAFGVSMEDGRAKFKKDELIGKEVQLNIQDSEYNGRKTSSVSNVGALEA